MAQQAAQRLALQRDAGVLASNIGELVALDYVPLRQREGHEIDLDSDAKALYARESAGWRGPKWDALNADTKGFWRAEAAKRKGHAIGNDQL